MQLASPERAQLLYDNEINRNLVCQLLGISWEYGPENTPPPLLTLASDTRLSFRPTLQEARDESGARKETIVKIAGMSYALYSLDANVANETEWQRIFDTECDFGIYPALPEDPELAATVFLELYKLHTAELIFTRTEFDRTVFIKQSTVEAGEISSFREPQM